MLERLSSNNRIHLVMLKHSTESDNYITHCVNKNHRIIFSPNCYINFQSVVRPYLVIYRCTLVKETHILFIFFKYRISFPLGLHINYINVTNIFISLVSMSLVLLQYLLSSGWL